MSKKWIGVIVLAVVGLVLAFVAIEYLSQPISKVPSYLGGHHARGHFKRRGEAAAVLAVIAFAAAGYLAYTITRKPKPAATGAPGAIPAPQATATSAEGLLSGGTTTPAAAGANTPPAADAPGAG